MTRITRIFIAVLSVALVAVCWAFAGEGEHKHDHDTKKATAAEMSAATVGQAAPQFTLMSASGNEHSLSDFKGKYVVLEWVNFDCPFVKAHYGSGNIPELQLYYADKGVVWLTVCSSAPGKQGYFAGEELTKRIKSENWQGKAYLIDADGTVGKAYGAKTTPHMYIISPEGTLVYAGAIDDTPTTKAAQIPESSSYVTAALDAAMNGKQIANASTTSYGCSVKY